MTASDEKAKFEKALSSVERDETGAPLIVSRYGYVIKEIGGKSYVVAAMPEEIAEIESIRSNTEKSLILSRLKDEKAKRCLTLGLADCRPLNGCISCDRSYGVGRASYCYCHQK